jgi:hypothetical protein
MGAKYWLTVSAGDNDASGNAKTSSDTEDLAGTVLKKEQRIRK